MTIQHRAAHRRFGAITQSANASVITAETDRDVTGEFAWIGDHLGRYAPRRRRSAGRNQPRGLQPMERIPWPMERIPRRPGWPTSMAWSSALPAYTPLSQNRRESGIMPGRDVGHQAGNAPAAVGRHHEKGTDYGYLNAAAKGDIPRISGDWAGREPRGAVTTHVPAGNASR